MSREEILGRGIWDLYPDTDRHALRGGIARAVVEQKPSVFEYFYPARDRWYENRLYPSADGLTIFFAEVTERKRAEEQLAADLAGMRRLQEVSTQLVRDGDSARCSARSWTPPSRSPPPTWAPCNSGRRFRHAQDGRQPRLRARVLEFFDIVHEGECPCGTAMQRRERVVIEDVTTSPVFAGKPSLDLLLAAGIRAAQSTPLFGRSGHLVGMLSTHYRTPRAPADRDLHVLDLLARQAADWIGSRAGSAVRARAAPPRAALRRRSTRRGRCGSRPDGRELRALGSRPEIVKVRWCGSGEVYPDRSSCRFLTM